LLNKGSDINYYYSLLGSTYTSYKMKSTIKRNMNIAKYKITNCAGGRHNMSPPLQVDLWPFDLKSGVRVTCDVGYLCANFSLPRPLCFQLRPMCTRQTDRRQTSDRKTSDEHRCL